MAAPWSRLFILKTLSIQTLREHLRLPPSMAISSQIFKTTGNQANRKGDAILPIFGTDRKTG
jgi:hypothetical protein